MANEADYESKYPDEKLYLVKGSTLNRLLALIKRARPRAGNGITVNETDAGTTISANGAGGGGGLGPVWMNVTVSGQPMYEQVNAAAPVATLPSGLAVVNPD